MKSCVLFLCRDHMPLSVCNHNPISRGYITLDTLSQSDHPSPVFHLGKVGEITSNWHHIQKSAKSDV